DPFNDLFFNDYGDYDPGRATDLDRYGDYYGRGRDVGNRIPIQERIPRHVGSRVMTEREGDVVWRPSTDVYETNEAIFIHVDLPGVPKEEISVDLRDREIVISGERRRGPSYEAATSRVRERQIGKFRKENIILSYFIDMSLDRESIEAKYLDGLLEIKIPRGTSKATGRVQIQ
ncbi:5129_t:CDS:2, partial [Acaulospora morrowiae]